MVNYCNTLDPKVTGITYSPLGTLLTRIITSKKFCEQFFKIYIEHYKRNFVILELLATKQDLDIERQVFRLVRDHITIKKTKLTLSHLVNLHHSHINREVVQTPERIAQAGIIINL